MYGVESTTKAIYSVYSTTIYTFPQSRFNCTIEGITIVQSRKKHDRLQSIHSRAPLLKNTSFFFRMRLVLKPCFGIGGIPSVVHGDNYDV